MLRERREWCFFAGLVGEMGEMIFGQFVCYNLQELESRLYLMLNTQHLGILKDTYVSRRMA